jgi:hypothetical protein
LTLSSTMKLIPVDTCASVTPEAITFPYASVMVKGPELGPVLVSFIVIVFDML